jgi:omega-6 fatty acid desaturase (delta-12 desaturase)
MVEIWWNKMVFPNEKYMPTRRPIFTKDCWLITVFGAAWVAVMVWAAMATEQSIALTLVMGLVVPFFFWVSMIGFVVYVHHTHVDVSWHEERTGWSKAAPFVSTTVHLTFPWHVGAMMHHIMEHTAHHLDMSIPLYKLKQAQSKLEELLPGRIVVQPFSWKWYFQTARDCKLYDFKTDSWTRYDGTVTSPRAMKAA